MFSLFTNFFKALKIIFLSPFMIVSKDLEFIKTKYKERKKSVMDLWESNKTHTQDFPKKIFTHIDNKKEYSFEGILATWGILPYGEFGIQQVKKTNQVMSLGCIVLCLSFLFFMLYNFVNINIIASITCIFGAVSTGGVAMVTSWRWWILHKRQYVPFLIWLKQGQFMNWKRQSKILKTVIFAFIMTFSLFGSMHVTHAADSIDTTGSPQIEGNDNIKIDLPKGVTLDKQTDVTAAVFQRLFGEAFSLVAGIKSGDDGYERGGMGVFSGLIVAMLGTINLGALIYCVGSIVYAGSILGVSAASQGKTLGSSIYNSVWTPVRQFCTISLTVPILNGLSLLQVAILAMVSLSINFANVVWDQAGDYIVKHMHVGIIDSSIPLLETEAYNALPVMFEDSVIQEIEKTRAEEGKSIWTEKLEEKKAAETGFADQVDSITFINAEGNQDPQGAYVKIINNASGVLHLRARPPKSLDIDDMGSIKIPYPKYRVLPKMAANRGSGRELRYTKDTSKEAEKSIRIAEIRLLAYLKMWEEVSKHARNYLKSPDSGGTACIIPGSDGRSCNAPLEKVVKANIIVDRFRKSVTQDAESVINQLIDSDKEKRLQMESAIDSYDGKSRYGWASAGLFTYTLAALQKKVDDEVLKTTSVSYREKDSKDQTTGLGWFFKSPYVNGLSENQRHAVMGSSDYVSRTMLENSRFASSQRAKNIEHNDDVIKEIAATAMSVLVVTGNTTGRNEGDSSGLLGAVLEEFSKYDPIVVMSSFGNRMLAAGTTCLGIAVVGAALVSKVVSVLFILSFFMIGATFAYVVPITPVLFWMRALISWLFLVIESMFGAPFWACTHMLPGGDGFASQKAIQGYMMMLDILIRPVLLVAGAVCTVALVQVSGWLIVTLMNSWFANIGETFISMNIFADMMFSVVFMTFMYFVSLHIFTKGVTFMPERISRWAGGAGSSLDESSDTQRSVMAAGVVLTQGQGIAAGAAGTGAALGSGLGNKLKGMMGNKDSGEGGISKGELPKNSLPQMSDSGSSSKE